MATKNGLLAPTATHGALTPSYYALVNGGTLVAPTLIEPVAIKSQDLATNATLFVNGLAAGAYEGALTLSPGANAVSVIPGDGITIRTAAGPSTIVEIGTNAQGPNRLFIAGASGVGQVYDEVYNQPIALQTITIVAADPDCVPTGGAEIFRCAQAAVAQAGAGTIQFNRIQVPRTGAYMMQSEIRMGNGPGANTVVLPSTLVGGVPVWNALTLAMQEFGTVIATPYSSVEVIGGDFQAIDTFASNSLTVKVYSQVLFLDATKVYTISLVANSALWNIGSAGQIKAELIAMC